LFSGEDTNNKPIKKMPAGILQFDEVHATEPTWHKKEKLHKLITFEESGLDWEVLTGKVFSDGNRLQDKGVEIPGYQEIYSHGPGGEHIHLHLAKSRYAPIQPKAVWEAMQKSLEGVACQITCTGSLQNRQIVFISVRLTGKDKDGFVVNGDKFKSELNFISSNNGVYEFVIFDSNTRIVCINTFNMAMSALCSSKLKHSARHTRNNQMKIDKISTQINKILESRKVFIGGCETMFKQKVSRDEALAFSVGWQFPGHRDKPSAAVIANSQGIVSAFENGDGNNGRNRYDLFNGVTQFFTRNTTRSDSDVYQSSFIGLGATRKGEAFDILANDETFRKTVRNGERALALIA
jgi:hypothetical protein